MNQEDAALHRRIAELESENARLKQAHSETDKAQATPGAKKWKAELERLRKLAARSEELEAELKCKDEQMESMEIIRKQLEDTVSNYDTDLENVQRELDALRASSGNAATLEAEVAAMTERIQKLNTEAGAKAAEIEGMEGLIVTLRGNLLKIKDAVDAVRAESEAKDKRIEELAGLVDAASATGVEKMRNEIEKLGNDVIARDAEIEKLKGDIMVSADEVKRLRDENKALQQEGERTKGKLRKEVAALNEEIEELREAVVFLKSHQ